MGVSKNGWFILENPKTEWIKTGVIPMTSETSKCNPIEICDLNEMYRLIMH